MPGALPSIGFCCRCAGFLSSQLFDLPLVRKGISWAWEVRKRPDVSSAVARVVGFMFVGTWRIVDGTWINRVALKDTAVRHWVVIEEVGLDTASDWLPMKNRQAFQAFSTIRAWLDANVRAHLDFKPPSGRGKQH